MRKLLYLVLALVSLSVAASCIDRPDFVLEEEQMIEQVSVPTSTHIKRRLSLLFCRNMVCRVLVMTRR